MFLYRIVGYAPVNLKKYPVCVLFFTKIFVFWIRALHISRVKIFILSKLLFDSIDWSMISWTINGSMCIIHRNDELCFKSPRTIDFPVISIMFFKWQVKKKGNKFWYLRSNFPSNTDRLIIQITSPTTYKRLLVDFYACG